MKKPLRNKRRGFTLLEILIVVLIIGVLAVFVIPRMFRQVEKAKQVEAITRLGAIRSSELLLHNVTGKFVTAADNAEIQTALGLIVADGFYKYKIVDADSEDFLALATPIGPLSDWLKEFGINKDGFVGLDSTGGGFSGSSGGGSGGSSGGGSSGGSSGSTVGGGSNKDASASAGYETTHGSVGGEAIVIVDPPPTDPQMPFPTDVTATANDGWLHVGWDPGTTGSAAIVYRAPKIDGVIGDFSILNGTPNDGWSDQVANDVEYCYQVTSFNTTTEEQSEPSAPPVCGTASATAPAALAVTEAEASLATSRMEIDGVEGVSSGEQLVEWLDASGFSALYGKTSCIVVNGSTLCTEAYFDPNTETIVMGLDFLSSAQESAVVLSHESMHAIWYADYDEYLRGVPGHPQYGVPPDPPGGVRSVNSIEQEYEAFLTDLQVYYDLKKHHGMSSVLGWDSILPKFLSTVNGKPLASDSEAKIYLRSMYTELPEY